MMSLRQNNNRKAALAAFRLYSVPLAGECGGTWGREKRLIGKEKEVFLQKKKRKRD